jgi:hypothetical protein
MSLRPDTARLLTGAAIDDPAAIRRAGADVLSLALIDARNELLRWLAAFEAGGMLDARHGWRASCAKASERRVSDQSCSRGCMNSHV